MKRMVIGVILGTMIISSATMSFADSRRGDNIILNMNGSDQEMYITSDSEGNPYILDMAYDVTGDSLESMELDYEKMSFKEYMGDTLSLISAIDKTQMEKHYNAAEKYEEEGKYDLADKEWAAYDKLMEKYDDAIRKNFAKSLPTYEEFKKELKEYMRPADSKSDKEMKTLYDAALSYEKNGKFKEADKKWDEFYEKFESFADFPEEDMAYEALDFKAYMGDLLTKVSATDKVQMEKHYNAAEKHMKDNKYDLADKEWDAFEKLMEKYEDEFRKIDDKSLPSYSEYMKDSKEFMKTVDSKSDKAMKALYNAALSHEKNGEFKEADKKWSEFDKLFESFIDEAKLEQCNEDGSL